MSAAVLSFTTAALTEARADTVGEAHQRLSNAHNQYYEAIKAQPNAANVREARKRILAPAEAQMRQAMSDQLKETAQKFSTAGSKRKRTMALGIPGSGSKPGETPAQPQPTARGGTTAVPTSGASQPEVVLDGKNVPHEMTFGQPTAKPSP